jgi:hypothetical protein
MIDESKKRFGKTPERHNSTYHLHLSTRSQVLFRCMLNSTNDVRTEASAVVRDA